MWAGRGFEPDGYGCKARPLRTRPPSGARGVRPALSHPLIHTLITYTWPHRATSPTSSDKTLAYIRPLSPLYQTTASSEPGRLLSSPVSGQASPAFLSGQERMKSLSYNGGRTRRSFRGAFFVLDIICYILLGAQCVQQAKSDCLDVSKLITLPEDTPLGSLILNTTVDLLSLKTSSSVDSGLVEVVNTSLGLSVRLARAVDAETIRNAFKRFPVFCANTATDVTTSTEIRLIIQDVNEFAPVFPQSEYSVNISESTVPQSIVFTFKTPANGAYDRDITSDTIGYTFGGGNTDGFFSITPEGNILLNNTLDYEKDASIFILTVDATEQGTVEHLSTPTTLTIHVEDADDENPVFGSSFYTLTLPEGVYDGSQVYPTSPLISAQDGDRVLNESIVFSIDESSVVLYNNLFSITPTGNFTVSGRLFIGTYSVNIRASQTDRPRERYAVAVVLVNVTDVNDHAPVMGAAAYNVTITEGVRPGFTLLTVTADDSDQGDNAVFHFELDDPSNTFAVVSNGRQGEIQLMNPVDREVKEIYVFQVSAVESRTSQQFRSQPSQVLVRVLDKNDNSPVFQKDSYEFDVPRTALRGFQIGQVGGHLQTWFQIGQVSIRYRTWFQIGQVSIRYRT
ncbi:protocadherin-like protein [Plakobranchus ocellatus]|uniref:Protocadherin-like protein n=1 Tax=Plakobranchus ocellatus TaxID=259542 RepID=A0AAV3YM90_9GAST|nr:protocadherin-like protein [Plakobranchus ocellatus]